MNNTILTITYLILTAIGYSQQSVPTIRYKLKKILPHNPASFTQGLVIANNKIYESTGLYGKSSLQQHQWPQGTLEKKININKAFFGEGIALYGKTLWQLTWREHVVFVYDIKSFKLIKKYDYPGEGWGLTHDGESFIMTNGTRCYQYRSHNQFSLLKEVCLNHPITSRWQLNDITYQNGYLYANIFYHDLIAKIEAKTGKLVGMINLQELRKKIPKNQHIDVLNGISSVSENTLLITGKFWPYMFYIELKP